MMHASFNQVKVTASAFNNAGNGNLDDQIHTGILEEVGPGILTDDPDTRETWGGILTVGNVLHYRGGFKIGDAIFINPLDIIAYEEGLQGERGN